MAEDRTMLGPYELDRIVGHGGMADLWLGTHVEHEVQVAVKVLQPAPDETDLGALFQREVEAVAALDHPNIIRVLDYGHVPSALARGSRGMLASGAPYLVMEYADSGSLYDLMRSDYGYAEVRDALLQMLDGLAHAHARDVIHRDLKPDNVLRFSSGEWKLADFGIATSGTVYDDVERNPAGTPQYMSPEQFQGYLRELGPWSDLYGLGCLAYQLVSGGVPFQSESILGLMRSHRDDEPPPIKAKFPIPYELVDWIERLLAKAPADRFQRAADAAWVLRRMPETVAAGPRAGAVPGARRETRPEPAVEARTVGNPKKTIESVDRETMPFEVAQPSDRPPIARDWRGLFEMPTRSLLDGASPRLFGLRATPMVGRENERDRLWRSLTALDQADSESVFLVTGPAGAGKTRLARWLRETAHESGAAITLRSDTAGSRPSAQTPMDLLLRHFVLLGVHNEDLADRVDELERQIGIHPRSAILVFEAWRRAREQSGELPRGWVDACARTFELAARSRPIVSFIDNLQAAPLWLEFLHRAPPMNGVMFVATLDAVELEQHREVKAAVEAVIEARGAEIIEVQPLARRECEVLVQDLLRLDRGLASRVAVSAGGNPMFATQLVGDWIARGWLVARADGWQLAAGADPSIPDDLHDVWQSRLDHSLSRRPASDRLALEAAAVLGSTVELGDWEEVLHSARIPPAGGLVEVLVADGFAVREERAWRFAHEMVRQSILRRCRDEERYRDLNMLVAKSLLQRTRSGALAGRVGRHLFEAGLLDEAIEPLFAGAKAALRASDPLAAAELLELHRSAVEDTSGGSPQYWEGQLLLAKCFQQSRRMADAMNVAEGVLETARALGWEPLVAEASALMARLSSAKGDQRHTREYAEEALRIFAELGDQEGIADAHLRLGDYYSYVAEPEKARINYRAARQAAVETGSKFSEAWAWWGEGFVDTQRGRLERARACLEQAVTGFRELGDEYWAQNALTSLGDVERLSGNFDRALAIYDESDAFVSYHGTPPAAASTNRALLALMRGRMNDARRETAEAKVRLGQEDAPIVKLAISAVDATLAAYDGDFERWKELVEAIPDQAERANIVEVDLVWAYDLAIREAYGRFDAARVRPFVDRAARYWRRLNREGEARAIEQMVPAD